MSRLLLTATLTASLTGCIVVTGPTETASDTIVVEDPVEALGFDLGAGDLTVRVGDVEQIEVHRTFEWRGEAPDALIALDGTTLVLDVDCARGLTSWCAVDHEVLVPHGLDVSGITGAGDVYLYGTAFAVDVETGAGDVEITDAGDVTVLTGAGDVRLTGVAGALVAETGAGDLHGTDLTGPGGLIDTGAGDVDLAWAAPPVDLTIGTGAGDVLLVLPAGTYAFDVETGFGDLDMQGLSSDPLAEGRVSVSTGAGSVTLRGVDLPPTEGGQTEPATE